MPYYRFGKLTERDIEEKPYLKGEKERYDRMLNRIQGSEGSYIFKKYLEEK